MSNESLSFERDIKPLFRANDIDEMMSWFDLSKYDDVKEHAVSIYERMADGTMPCDGKWSDSNLAKFKSWIETGCPQ